MEAKEDFLQKLGSIELTAASIKIFVFGFNQSVKIGQDGVIRRLQPVKIGVIGDAPFFIELLEHDFDHIDLPVGEILVCPEKILKKADVLAELAGFQESFRHKLTIIAVICVSVPLHFCAQIECRLSLLIPAFRLQNIDDMLSGH